MTCELRPCTWPRHMRTVHTHEPCTPATCMCMCMAMAMAMCMCMCMCMEPCTTATLLFGPRHQLHAHVRARAQVANAVWARVMAESDPPVVEAPVEPSGGPLAPEGAARDDRHADTGTCGSHGASGGAAASVDIIQAAERSASRLSATLNDVRSRALKLQLDLNHRHLVARGLVEAQEAKLTEDELADLEIQDIHGAPVAHAGR